MNDPKDALAVLASKTATKLWCEFDEARVRALFTLAGISIKSLYELPNQYWQDHPDYADLRKASPWWLANTDLGLIRIGWRKRVIHIDWKDTDFRGIITTDDVTKDDTMVHACGYEKVIEHLTALASKMKEKV